MIMAFTHTHRQRDKQTETQIILLRTSPLECPTPQTTVTLPGVPNLAADYRETTWSAQPRRLP